MKTMNFHPDLFPGKIRRSKRNFRRLCRLLTSKRPAWEKSGIASRGSRKPHGADLRNRTPAANPNYNYPKVGNLILLDVTVKRIVIV
jgi:hypothetical protein